MSLAGEEIISVRRSKDKWEGGESMEEKVEVKDVGALLGVLKPIYVALRPWLKLQASRTESPFDDWMLKVLDSLFGVA